MKCRADIRKGIIDSAIKSILTKNSTQEGNLLMIKNSIMGKQAARNKVIRDAKLINERFGHSIATGEHGTEFSTVKIEPTEELVDIYYDSYIKQWNLRQERSTGIDQFGDSNTNNLQYQRQSYFGKDSDKVFERKKKRLIELFAKHGVKVRFTETNDSNFVEKIGDKSVRINIDKNRRFKDSLFHEFGHIYVDLLGLNNPRVQTGIKHLKDTMLWDETKHIYPELSDELLAKEVITTAIGREAAKIDTNNEVVNKIKFWLNRFFREIAEFLGIEVNQAKALAYDIVGSKLNEKFEAELEDIRQEQRDREWVNTQDKFLKFVKDKIVVYNEQLENPLLQEKDDIEAILDKIDVNKILKKKDLAESYKAFLMMGIYDRKMLMRLEKGLKNYDKKYHDVAIEDIRNEEYRRLGTVLNQTHLFIGTYRLVNDLEIVETEDGELNDLQKKINDLIDHTQNFKEHTKRINSLKNSYKRLVDKYLTAMIELSSNEDIKGNAKQLLSEGFKDEKMTQYLFDALMDSNNPLLANFGKFEREADNKKESESFDKKKEFYKKFKEFNGKTLDIINEKGFLIPKYNFDEYYISKDNMYEESKKIQDESKRQIFIDKWLNKNQSNPYIEAFYERERKISNEALYYIYEFRRRKDQILDKYRYDNNNNKKSFSSSKISIEDRRGLRHINQEKKFFMDESNFHDDFKEIAKELKSYYTNDNRFEPELIDSIEKFKTLESTKKGDEKSYNIFRQRDLKATDRFWSEFNRVLRAIGGKKNKEINKQINKITDYYKDDNGVIIGDLVSDKDKERILKLERSKHLDDEGNPRNYEEESASGILGNALDDLRELIEIVPTEYYYKEYSKKFNYFKSRRKDKKLTTSQFKQTAWYKENHWIDPYTGEEVPLPIWTTMLPRNSEIKFEKSEEGKINFTGHTMPGNTYMKYKVNESYINSDYEVDDRGKPMPSKIWKNKVYTDMKDNHREFRDYLDKLLKELTSHHRGTLQSHGLLPAVGTEEYYKNNRKTYEVADTIVADVLGDQVYTIPFRFIGRLSAEKTIPIRKQKSIETNEEYEINVIEELQNEGYEFDTLDAVKEENKKIRERNEKAHMESLNLNIYETIPLFIDAALEHKYRKEIESDVLLFLAEFKNTKILKENGVLESVNDYYRSKILDEEIKATVSAEQSNSYRHLEAYIRMKFYGKEIKDEGKLTEYGLELKNLISLKGIGFNIFSATKNVTYGQIQTAIEAGAGYHFDYGDYVEAKKIWWSGANSYIMDTQLDGNRSSTEANAHIKFWNVIQSQSELNDLEGGRELSKKYTWKMFKNVAYFMQESGEHNMQNQTLFAMLNSHRIVDGNIMSFVEYKSKFAKKPSKKEIDDNASVIEDYNNKVEELKKKFEKHTKLKDAFYLKDGYLEQRKDIVINEYQINEFKEKVRGVNHKIHGIYNKADKGVIENWILGQMLMQFRHWAMPGWNKRFGSRWGEEFWNERRREKDKGSYTSLWEFATIPFRENSAKNWSSEEERTWTTVSRAVLEGYGKLFANARVYWFLLDDTDKANVKRAFQELLSIVASLALFGLLKAAIDDDDDKKQSTAWNFVLYQADNLSLELSTYTPVYGWFNEGTKLLANPMATWGTMQGVIKLARAAFMYPVNDFMDMEEKNYFKGGSYHDELKVGVYTKKLIPLVNQIERWNNIEKNNRYYRLF